METLTSPPLARIRLIIAAGSVSDETARVPSQVGVQPPPLGARMNASWNAFCPVAFMTSTGSGGLLSNGIRYGAEAYQLLVSMAGVGVQRDERAGAEHRGAGGRERDQGSAFHRRSPTRGYRR